MSTGSAFLSLKSTKFLWRIARVLSSGAVLMLPFAQPSLAQLRVIPDGSTATELSTGSADCTVNCTITGTSAVGGNLFHSFSEFSIPDGVVVTFDDGGNNNIFTRVSDPTQSSVLLGNLSVTGAANFFLINPAGITFGEDASLSLNGGSFVASTGERLSFEDKASFVAGAPTEPVQLTMSTPVGLQFGRRAAPIVNRSQASVLPSGRPIGNTLGAPAGLRVNPFQTLALLGGDLTLEGGNVTALGGRIELGSVESGSQIDLGVTNQGIDFVYSDALSDTLSTQDIQLVDSLIDVGGPGGGQIHLQGRDVALERSGLFNASFDRFENGEVAIDAIALTLDNSAVQAITFSPSLGADVTFNIDTLELNNDSVVSAETKGQGNSGHVTIQGFNSQDANPIPASRVSLDASFLGTEVGPGALGDGGNVELNTRVLILQDAGILANTFGEGAGGNLKIAATESATLQGDSQIATTADEFWQAPGAPEGVGITTADVGDAGNIQLTGGDVLIAEGSQVQATTFGDAGNGGDVTIRGNDVTLIGESVDGRSSGVFSQVEAGTTTGTLSESSGGFILVDVGTLRLLDGGLVSASALGSGTAGDITVRSADRVEIVGGEGGSSGLFAIGEDDGQSGSIEVWANQLRLAARAQITASTQTTDGGNVDLTVQESVVLRDRSLISARAGEGGSGGNVTIETDFLVGEEATDSDIVANAIQGVGGNVQISALGILGFAEGVASAGNGTNDIDASSQFGTNGVVTIENLEAEPTQGLVPLAENLADLSNQIGESCGSTGSFLESHFTITGRGGLLPTPEVALRDRRLFADMGIVENSLTAQARSVQSVRSSGEEPAVFNEVIEAQGWHINDDGEISLFYSEGDLDSEYAPDYLYANCTGTTR